MTALERLKAAIPDAGNDKDALLTGLLEQAKEFILAFCYRDMMPTFLENTWIRLALVYYDRAGAEGESARGEGGITRSFYDLPVEIRDALIAHRLTPGALRERRTES